MTNMKDFNGPVHNMNGDSYVTLEDNYEAVQRAADDLLDAMAQAMPHGRNYQTVAPGTEVQDRNSWHEAIRDVVAIRDRVGEVRIDLHKARPKSDAPVHRLTLDDLGLKGGD